MNSYPHHIDICAGAMLFVVSDSMDVDITRRMAELVRRLDTYTDDAIIEIIPSYGSVLVIYDESVTTPSILSTRLYAEWNQCLLPTVSTEGDIVTVDVVYGDSYGDDLANVSAVTGKSVDEVITLHVSTSYTVGAVGFSPGFTYLIGLPPELTTPRRTKPRLRVPAGSVGIGGAQTGIYALPSSGGWNLIGRTNTTLFDPAADPPVRLKLGDSIRFHSVDSLEFAEPERSHPEGDGPVEVLSPGMQTTVQDMGRYGFARSGFATDGAADRASLAAANRLVGNLAHTAALECTYVGPHLRFHRRLALALYGADLGARLNSRDLHSGRRFEVMPGDELTFAPVAGAVGARAYLAVRGGYDVPLVLGSASTNLIAGIGGWHGRALLTGDRLGVGQRALPSRPFMPGIGEASHNLALPFRVQPGPQRERFGDDIWQRLLESTFTVSQDANRVGLRLDGLPLPPLTGADILSEGITTGSIQITGEGQPIVMLPGHATIGGYTKIATVIPQDWDRLGQLSPGDEVRFVSV
ncbi:MAG: 5-oxoprolinase subunit PxpB [Thermomicrobiales bacterium]|nr:5-oxoprolinase subunit PxpB [Thermomicrobiales bacterium]